ncbi:MAG: ATP-dependent DNA helicase RecG [Methylacidiphilales bacterium]|nr:ATP-dependent DNA helicase RecG [Candidatus Methylacidiphilales bacterium]MDW8349860.1 ATP-dependent DNA helicase RecG [Verrucomicrobiae bacterium]
MPIKLNSLECPEELELERVLRLPRAQIRALKKMGFETPRDLLLHLPVRYEDRTQWKSLSEAEEGEALTYRGRISSARLMRWKGGREVFEIWIAQKAVLDRKNVLRCMWFHMPYLAKILTQGKEVIVYGRLKMGKQSWVMIHPDYEVLSAGDEEHIHIDRWTPIYRLTEGIGQRGMRRAIWDLIQLMRSDSPSARISVDEIYPPPTDMLSLSEALSRVHFPRSLEEAREARRRLVYDEFFYLQCLVAKRKAARLAIPRHRPPVKKRFLDLFLKNLGFPLTRAQSRAIQEIQEGLSRPSPMHRLLQGDVGAGKTIVATAAMILAVERGENAALMAPTEILAEQHYYNLRGWLEPLGISVGLLTGSKKIYHQSPLDTDDLLKNLYGEHGHIVVGTHALLYESYDASNLGMIVIDEQHKFGVMQRLALINKGSQADVLVMSATPIPRTLAMTVYGDLEVSILDELPPGRGKVITAVRCEEDLPKVWSFMKKELEKGHQAYVVYPLVEESEKLEAKAVQSQVEELRRILSPYKVDLMHGRLSAEEKQQVMQSFREGRTHVLVSTTVIEVGVDVPQATMMVIENAERFGLAQLHQLRGRVGRGKNQKSYCVLIGDPAQVEGWRRLKILEETHDGFRVAEEDLKIRGPGNVLGTEQSGLPPLAIGDPLHDLHLLERAREQAESVIHEDPELGRYPKLKAYLTKLEGSIPLLKAIA